MGHRVVCAVLSVLLVASLYVLLSACLIDPEFAFKSDFALRSVLVDLNGDGFGVFAGIVPKDRVLAGLTYMNSILRKTYSLFNAI